MVRTCGGGGSGPLIHSWAIHFCGCVVVFARARSSLFMRSLLWSWWTVSAGCSSPHLWGGCCVCRHSSFVGGGARCCPQVEHHPWGLIVIWGGVSSSVGGASPSVGGHRPCLWGVIHVRLMEVLVVVLVTHGGLSILVGVRWHEGGCE